MASSKGDDGGADPSGKSGSAQPLFGSSVSDAAEPADSSGRSSTVNPVDSAAASVPIFDANDTTTGRPEQLHDDGPPIPPNFCSSSPEDDKQLKSDIAKRMNAAKAKDDGPEVITDDTGPPDYNHPTVLIKKRKGNLEIIDDSTGPQPGPRFNDDEVLKRRAITPDPVGHVSNNGDGGADCADGPEVSSDARRPFAPDIPLYSETMLSNSTNIYRGSDARCEVASSDVPHQIAYDSSRPIPDAYLVQSLAAVHAEPIPPWYRRKWGRIMIILVTLLGCALVITVMYILLVRDEASILSEFPSVAPSLAPTVDPRPTLDIVRERGEIQCGLKKQLENVKESPFLQFTRSW